MLKPLATVALNNSTYTAITLAKDVRTKTVFLQCDSAIDVNISDTLAGTLFWTVKSGSFLTFQVAPNVQEGVYTLCYAKSASSTPNLQVLQVD